MPVLLGTAKASIGHGEAVSGLLGLSKAILGVQRAEITGNTQLRALNPLVGARMSGRAIPTDGSQESGVRAACVKGK